ncbi:MAG TPA: IS3 family transposase [Gemmatimonadales bacterium]|nr:IS3 family transposase [Gemmatimonadales bacterium]
MREVGDALAASLPGSTRRNAGPRVRAQRAGSRYARCRPNAAPRVHAALRTQGEPPAQKRVARLMREDGLVGAGRRTTDSPHAQPLAPNVLQRPLPSRPGDRAGSRVRE